MKFENWQSLIDLFYPAIHHKSRLTKSKCCESEGLGIEMVNLQTFQINQHLIRSSSGRLMVEGWAQGTCALGLGLQNENSVLSFPLFFP